MAEELGERVAKLEADRANDRKFMEDLRDQMRDYFGMLQVKIDALGTKIDRYESARNVNRNCDKEESINKAAWKRLFILLWSGAMAAAYGCFEFFRSGKGGG